MTTTETEQTWEKLVVEVFYDGDKEQVFVGDVYLQDNTHNERARGEWEVIAIDSFPHSGFPRVTRRNLKTGLVDVNGWNNRGKHLIRRTVVSEPAN